MYKITNNLQQINEINNAVKLKEDNQDSNYCKIDKHCKDELYAIPLDNSSLLSLGLSFITETWLTTDIVETLPKDWTWNFPIRQLRVTIPLEIQATALIDNVTGTGDKYDWLGQIISVVYPLFSQYILTTDTSVIVYLEELYPQHLQVIQMFEEIVIEVYDNPDIVDSSFSKQIIDFIVKN